MFCKGCYADLNRATDLRCPRCRRTFDPGQPSSYLLRPFPNRRRMLVHLLITLVLATVVSGVIAIIVGLAQLKYFHSGH